MPFELYKCNVLMLEKYKSDLDMYEKINDIDKISAMQGKMNGLMNVIENYEKVAYESIFKYC